MHDHKCIPVVTEGPIPTAILGPKQEALSKALTLVRICVSPMYNEVSAEYFERLAI